MTQSISYKSTVRSFNSPPALNSARNDYTTKAGVRICTPIYIDIPQETRKAWLNELRSLASATTVREVPSVSGLTTHSASNADAGIEAYLGLTIDTLRSAVLFQRGGIPIDMVLKLQSVTGIVALTEKDVAAALKSRAEDVKSFIADYAFEAEN